MVHAGVHMRRIGYAIAICGLLPACRLRVPLAPPVAVDGAKQAITAAVVSLERGETVVIDGQSLASTVVLPDFYRRRGFGLAWTDGAATDDLVRAARESADDGLEPGDYHLTAIDRLRVTAPSTPETRARLDLLLTDAAVLLAYHLRFGKVGPVPLDAEWKGDASEGGRDLASVLQRALEDRRVYQTLDDLKPRYPFYARLKRALAEYRRIAAAGGWAGILEGAPLMLGVTDERVPLLRRRLGISGDLPEEAAADPSSRFDATVAAGVKAFQERHGIAPDGAVGPATLRALDVPVAIRVDQIRATLERCRWVMQGRAERYVLVNVAGFTVAVVDQDVPIWEARVVVGDPYTQTPSFRADMRSIVLNPTWTVPPVMMRDEIGPAMRRDPRYLQRKGYRMVDGQVVQPAGPRNPLGRIKLVLPNPHSVYLHDTPSKSSFERGSRMFSHGCVRVEKPFELAALVLDDPTWTPDALLAAAAPGKTRTILVRRPLPVLVLYWTAAVDPDGRVRFLPDVYERDPAIIRGLAQPVAARQRTVSTRTNDGAA
jgi:murein L,D-transpeptidase YcbB/YkuD